MKSIKTVVSPPWNVLLALMVASSLPADAATLEVPSQYPTIQSAIDAAANGDLVLIAPGTYVESPVLTGKTITVASLFHTTGDRNYIDQTVIDGGGGARVIRVGASAALPALVGLTLRNASDGVSANGKFHFLDNRVTDTGDGIDYEAGSGGLVRGCVFEGNNDDGIDLDHSVTTIIENNTIRNNGDDGIEIRLQPYSGPHLANVIRNNSITGNDEDGIQFISYDVLTPRSFHIEGNLILNNAMAGVGMMCCENSVENYQGASVLERIGLFNNTFSGNNYGVTGGDSLVAVNNVFVNTTNVALRNADGGSIAAYNLFFGNGTDHDQSNVDIGTTLLEDPLLKPDHGLASGSPAIDAGTASFEVDGVVVWSKDAGEYSGAAPDLGAIERTDTVDVIDGGSPWHIEFLPPTPNPSRGSTALSVIVPAAGRVRLEIVDVTGRHVRMLVDGIKAAGRLDFSWDGRDELNRPVPAGVYFARLKTSTQAESRRFVKLD